MARICNNIEQCTWFFSEIRKEGILHPHLRFIIFSEEERVVLKDMLRILKFQSLEFLDKARIQYVILEIYYQSVLAILV